MLRNYLVTGLRALTKHRTYAFINICGLALGIAACLLILVHVRYETSYDSWIEDADRTFQLQNFYQPTETGGEEYKLQVTNYASGTALAKDFAQVEGRVYMLPVGATVLRNGQATTPERAVLVDANLFEVLRLPLVRGDRASALAQVNDVALSESEARKYFGDADPVGQTLTLSMGGEPRDYRVTAVFEDLPPNSHLRMSMVARFDPRVLFADAPQILTSWNSQQGFIYVRLRDPGDADAIHAAMPAWEKRNIPDDVSASGTENPGDYQSWRLMPIAGVHLGEAQDAGHKPGNDRTTIATFAVIAALVLAMACINFVNLATARASQRAREVALRKVLGASRRQLVVQFIGESLMIAALATLVGLALAEIALPWLNAFLDADMTIGYWGGDGLWLPIILLVLVVGIAGGLYPALYLSRFQPARVLRSNKSAAEGGGSGRLRGLLVVVQFAISIGLIASTLIIHGQTSYVRSLDPGFRREGLIQVARAGAAADQGQAETLIEEVRRLPGVTAVGRTEVPVATTNNSTTDARRPGATQMVDLGTYSVDYNTFDALGARIVAGRDFDRRQARDDMTAPEPDDQRALAARGANVILSEDATRRLGFASAAAAVGQTIETGGLPAELGMLPATIVGVVGDVRYRPVREPLQPIVYGVRTDRYSHLLVRYAGVPPAEMLAAIEAVWQRLLPELPFSARFAGDVVDELYDADRQRAQLFAGFAALSVAIACLGLFGLAAFTAERRTKEIGIRKVLGARTHDVARLLIWQFTRPVVIANLVAWPIAWWAMRDWLNGFEVRLSLGPGPFAIAGVAAFMIAVATIAMHAVRVARQRPVLALRYE